MGGFSMGGSITLRMAALRPRSSALWAPVAGWIPNERLNDYHRGLRWVTRLTLYCGKEDRVARFNHRLARSLPGDAIEYVERPGGHTFRLVHTITPHLLRRVSETLYP